MIQIKYDDIEKRYIVKVPLKVASISEQNKITLHREVSVDILRQIVLKWDEYEYQVIKKGE